MVYYKTTPSLLLSLLVWEIKFNQVPKLPEIIDRTLKSTLSATFGCKNGCGVITTLQTFLRVYIHLRWCRKSKIFLLHFLKVHFLENIFPKNHKDPSIRTRLAAIDSSLSATTSQLRVTLHERLSRNCFFQKVWLR